MQSTRNYRFSNWAGNESCVAGNFYQPTTEEELKQAVAENSKIRFTGTGHSWNAICLSNETLVNLDKVNQIILLDKDALKLKVQGGAKLWQLNEYLDKQGLALQNLGSISKQSVAGAMSTATHGTGMKFQALPSQVEEFTLIKADGEKINVHSERDKELFNLALVNLGCLGVISDITLNVVPAFNLHEQTYAVTFDSLLDNMDELVNSNDHFKVWWFPPVEQVIIYRYRRTDEAVNDSRLRQWMMDEFLSVNVYRLLLKIGSINRNWRRFINQILVEKFIKPLDRIEKSYRVFNVDEPPIHRETEWGFDYKIGKEVLSEYRKMLGASKHRINFIQEIRFTKGDEYAMSPCYNRDTMWLGAYNADNYGWFDLLNDFEPIARAYKGRPHWGKEMSSVDAGYIQSVYPKYDEFNSLRKQFDPANKFMNDFMAKFFS